MKQHGTINHVALAVSDLDEAMQFFGPFLEYFWVHRRQSVSIRGHAILFQPQ